MKTIEIYESNQSCCGPSASAALVSFLQRKFKGEAEVRVVDLADEDGVVDLPATLIAKIASQGRACLPAVVLDGAVVATGKLPTFLDAVAMVRGTSAPGDVS